MIDGPEYFQKLETFRARPEAFPKDLEALLRGETLRQALAALEEQALLAEKTFMEIDFTQPEAAIRAVAVQERIKGLRAPVEIFVALANGEM